MHLIPEMLAAEVKLSDFREQDLTAQNWWLPKSPRPGEFRIHASVLEALKALLHILFLSDFY